MTRVGAGGGGVAGSRRRPRADLRAAAAPAAPANGLVTLVCKPACDDISEDGIEELANMVAALNNYDFGHQVEVIAASIRSANHVTQAALMGADIATVPFAVLKNLVKHPLTDRGLESFLADWEKVKNA